MGNRQLWTVFRAIAAFAAILLTLQVTSGISLGHPDAITRVQVVQSLGNQTNKYVAGKNTAILVRLSAPVAVDPTAQEVEVRRGGTTIAYLEPKPSVAPVSTLIFQCPTLAACDNWAAGSYTFIATVDDATAQATATLQTRKGLKVLALPVRANYGGQVRVPVGTWKRMGEFARSVYPLAPGSFQWTLGAQVEASAAQYNLLTDAGQTQMFNQVVKVQPKECFIKPRPANVVGCYDKVVAFVKDRMGPQGDTQGFTMGFGTNIVVESDEDAPATVAHEIGHNYDLGDEYDDGSYNCTLNPPHRTFVGRNIFTDAAPYSCSQSTSVLFPGAQANLINAAADVPFEVAGRGLLPNMASFMGSGALQSQNWISAPAWRRIFDGLAPTAAATSGKPADPQALSRWIYAPGYISQDGTVEIEPWYDFDFEGTQPNTTGAYTLQALDAGDGVLASTALDVDFTVVDQSDPLTQTFFVTAMPFPTNTTTFRIVHGATPLGELPVSPNAPGVQLQNPAAGEVVPSDPYTVTWTASDTDGGQLHYDLEYSADGVDWELIESDLETTQAVVDFADLPGTGAASARLRVTATDGLNSTESESPAFSVAAKAPEAEIVSPVENEIFKDGDIVWLEGVGYDLQDEDITEDARLLWSSNTHGVLGNGAELGVQNLEPGNHTFTLTVTNTMGLTGSASVSIVILPFSDVNPDDYFYEGVAWLYSHHAISGYADNTFRPFNTTTRGQLVKIVLLALGIPVQGGGTPTFGDVPASNPFYPYVETAVARGIIAGYTDEAHCGAGNTPCFKPNNDVTRGQIAKIMTAAAGWTIANPPTASFRDVPTSDPFYGWIETALAHGVISGYDCGTGCREFRPGNQATRGQVAKIVYLASTEPGGK